MGRYKRAVMLMSTAAVVALGLGIFAANLILPDPDNAIPAPNLGHFTMCQVVEPCSVAIYLDLRRV